MSTDGEQIGLYVPQPSHDRLVRHMAERAADDRVQFIHRAVGFNPNVVLARSSASEQAGAAVVATPRVDLHRGLSLVRFRMAMALSSRLGSSGASSRRSPKRR